MLYVNKDNELTADEIMVTSGSQVEEMVAEGWQILAIIGSTMPGQQGISNVNWQSADNYANSASLNLPGQSVFTPLFLMGRSSEDSSLYKRMIAAEQATTEAQDRYNKLENGEARKLRNQVSSLQKEVENNQAAMDQTISSLDGTRGKLTALELEVNRVRLEIGESRWREILGSLEVEKIMDGTAPIVDDDDDEVPF